MKSSKPKLVKLSSGDFWEPENVGDRFCGEITGRHVGETSYGEKPFIDITNVESGETIGIISANRRTRGLNTLPVGAYVEIEYVGDFEYGIGRKKKKARDFVVYAEAKAKRVEDWTKGQYYGDTTGKTKRKPKTAKHKKA